MNWRPVLVMVIAAFLTAASIPFYYQPENTASARATKSIRGSFNLRCTPLFIPSAEQQIPRLTGWGNYSWKITTSSDSAQFYFDQGINMYYAFHIIESRASFDKATRFDPACAMAWWGKAIAFGPNINDFGYAPPSEAFPSAAKAMQLKNSATELEKALIGAMAVRYADDSTIDQNKLNVQYKDAMNKVYQDYPGNPDVSALYADALMLLHPWDLYDRNFSPRPWTSEITGVLQRLLKASPSHPGANHYYIHAMEASTQPRLALQSAVFLSAAMPSVSHITHMPSHIFIRTGYYTKGIAQNDKALTGYQQYLGKFAEVSEGTALYSLHNTHMKMYCAQMAGSYSVAMQAAKQLQKDVPAAYLSIPGPIGHYAQYLDQGVLFTRLRFGRWEDILQEKVVDSLSYSAVLQHFARGMAFARTNQPREAIKELSAFKNSLTKPALKEPMTPFSSPYDASQVALNMLEGVIAEQQKDYEKAIVYFGTAVAAEDNLVYNEPRDWLLPARQYLGNVLLKAGKHKEALEVFNADLAINPNNGWDLTGVEKVLSKARKAGEPSPLESRIKEAWLIKDVAITEPVF